ncbi:MAG: DUF1559 domain-containing protein, partial [Gemmataceae bacterium]
EAADKSKFTDAAWNGTISSKNQAMLTCPSDPRHDQTYNLSWSGYPNGFGLAWYYPFDRAQFVDNEGIIVVNPRKDEPMVRLAGVLDGLSNTWLLAEKNPANSNPVYWGWWDYATYGDTRGVARATFPFFSVSSGTPSRPCGAPSVPVQFDINNACYFNSASSAHPGGFNALYGDGSVRFHTFTSMRTVITGTTPTRTLIEVLVTKAGGEVAGDL